MTEPVPGTPEVGAQFGPYHLLDLLGEGGGGKTWEAYDLRTDRRVALKVLTELTAESPETWARLEREVRLAASVSHVSCVHTLWAEEVDGRPTIVMEVMRGGTLRDLLTHGPVPVTYAVMYALDIIDGLEAAQDAGIIHRDVRPSNCFLDEYRGRAKVGDFGVWRMLEVASDLSLTGAFIGAPFYASPEQVRGQTLDFRSDLYSVGATLYELLTGRPPFSGSTLAVAAQILGDAPAPLSSLSRSVPKALDRVVMRLLAKDPGGRFGSYEELRQALTPFTPRAPLPETGSVPQRLGPYEVRGPLWIRESEGLLVARHPELRRTVWIHYYRDPGAAPPIEAMRQLHTGRRSWLHGSRSDTPAWDAYDCP